MNYIILGNIIAFIASLLIVYLGFLKQKKKILFVQTIQISLFIISNIILGGITGAIMNGISFIRNIICYKNKLNLFYKIVITILSVAFTLPFNNLGFIGLLPLVSTILYIWLMNTKSIIKFKFLISITNGIWAIYDFNIKLYSSVVFSALNIIANIYTIYKIMKTNNNKITKKY